MDEIIDRELNDRMKEYEKVSTASFSLTWATMCDQELRLIMELSLVTPLFEFHFRSELIFVISLKKYILKLAKPQQVIDLRQERHWNDACCEIRRFSRLKNAWGLSNIKIILYNPRFCICRKETHVKIKWCYVDNGNCKNSCFRLQRVSNRSQETIRREIFYYSLVTGTNSHLRSKSMWTNWPLHRILLMTNRLNWGTMSIGDRKPVFFSADV